MNFSFGIITDGQQDKRLQKIINKINSLGIPKFEIIIVGNTTLENVNKINFNENIKKGWITKKKNLITENSKYENIVYMHDYIIPDDNWYSGFRNLEFNICMTKILCPNGNRYRDWTLDAMLKTDHLISKNRRLERLLPYNCNLSDIMYISGAYWVAKKDIMQEFPLNESLVWGQSEDIEWSHRVRQKYSFTMNQNSSVRLLKNKKPYFIEIKDDFLKKLINMSVEEKSIILEHSNKVFKQINETNIS